MNFPVACFFNIIFFEVVVDSGIECSEEFQIVLFGKRWNGLIHK